MIHVIPALFDNVSKNIFRCDWMFGFCKSSIVSINVQWGWGQVIVQQSLLFFVTDSVFSLPLYFVHCVSSFVSLCGHRLALLSRYCWQHELTGSEPADSGFACFLGEFFFWLYFPLSQHATKQHTVRGSIPALTAIVLHATGRLLGLHVHVTLFCCDQRPKLLQQDPFHKWTDGSPQRHSWVCSAPTYP